MNIKQTWLIRAGVLAIVVTNAIALIGVAYNRKTPPDSVLTLTEQELDPQRDWMFREGENSGLSLRLEARAEGMTNPQLKAIEPGDRYSRYSAFAAVGWLDRDKLASLGFDVSMTPTADGSEKHYDHMLEREVLLVLELDGPIRTRALQAAHDRVTQYEQEIARDPGSTDLSIHEQLKNARQMLDDEEHGRSRLFIIDAGLNSASLRQRYPDRSHYAIVRGAIRPIVLRYKTTAALYGRVTAIRCDSIHVPLQFQDSVPVRQSPLWVPAAQRGDKTAQFRVQVAFGRRLEPWIVSAQTTHP